MKRFICIFLSLLLVAVMHEIAADSPKKSDTEQDSNEAKSPKNKNSNDKENQD